MAENVERFFLSSLIPFNNSSESSDSRDSSDSYDSSDSSDISDKLCDGIFFKGKLIFDHFFVGEKILWNIFYDEKKGDKKIVKI